MYVSMNPKGETGKVIHISQNDTNREVEFIPYDQNGLTPLTDGQLTARINSIKGNTVSFNQLVQNGNFVNYDYWTSIASVNLNIANNEATITTSSIDGIKQSFNSIVGHKYYLSFYAKEITNLRDLRFVFRTSSAGYSDIQFNALNVYEKKQAIITCLRSETLIEIFPREAYSDYQFSIKNVMIFDLTLMGIDNLTTTAEVEEYIISHLGNLEYFGYTPGMLVPFMGTGLKTTGKNLFTYDEPTYTNTIMNASGEFVYADNYNCYIFEGGHNYVFTYNKNTNFDAVRYGTKSNGSWTRHTTVNETINIDATNAEAICLSISLANGWILLNPMLEFGSTTSIYEPYTSNTLSLPISTYFPTGMKAVPTVYDELSDKAYTRVGSMTLNGTESWGAEPTSWASWPYIYYLQFSNDMPNYDRDKVYCTSDRFISTSINGLKANTNYGYVAITGNGNYIEISTPQTSLADFKTWLQSNNVTVYYELATPIETTISPELDLTHPVWNGGTEQILPVNTSTPTTSPIKANITYPDRTEDTEFLYKQTSFEWIYKSWAFVCKNITQALSVVGNALKGTIPGTMTSESGKFPLKLKMTDNDGVCFSEKIDLFVEKKP